MGKAAGTMPVASLNKQMCGAYAALDAGNAKLIPAS